jgi:flagellar motor switch protein FliM
VTLNQDELDALMGAIQDGRALTDSAAAAEKPAATPYDLTSQDRVLRGQMPTLDAINESVASVLGSGLAGRTRLSLKVTAAPTTLLKFVDFNGLLANSGALCILSLGANFGLALCLLEPGLAETLLAAALGNRKPAAASSSVPARRDLTAVEQLVLRRLLGILTEAMAAQWGQVLPLKPEVLRFETDPRLAVIAPPGELAVVTSFELAGAIEGRLQLVLPYATLEPVKQRLAAPAQLSRGGDQRFARAMEAEVEQVRVELRGVLGRATVPFGRMLELAVGDVLVLGTEEGAELPILVQGRLKMTGTPRITGGSMALTVAQDLRKQAALANARANQTGRNDGHAAAAT